MSKPKKDKNIRIPSSVLGNLLTPSEWRMVKNRYQIISLLDEGLSIRKIAKKIKVGTDTVTRVARIRERKKITFRTSKTQTPWIFGKSND